jgi:hypothetical protein
VIVEPADRLYQALAIRLRVFHDEVRTDWCSHNKGRQSVWLNLGEGHRLRAFFFLNRVPKIIAGTKRDGRSFDFLKPNGKYMYRLL